MTIKWILVDGDWVNNPTLVKKEFLEFYKKKFMYYQGVYFHSPSSQFQNLNGQNLLWVDLIKSCYGQDGGFYMSDSVRHKSRVCMGIIKLVWDMYNKGLITFDSIYRKVGNGENTRFWLDVWCGDIVLKA